MVVVQENIINPLYNLWEDIKIRNDYVIWNNNQHKLHYYLDLFKYEIELNKDNLILNVYYWIWKVQTQWFRELELLTDKKRDLSDIIENISNKYEYSVWDTVCLWNDYIIDNSIWQGSLKVYSDNWVKFGKIDKILISWRIEFNYHPKSWKKLKWFFKSEIVRYIIDGVEYNRNEIQKRA